MLPRRAPVQRGLLRLGRRLLGARLGQARPRNDLCQFTLILRRVKAPIERGFFDGSLQALLDQTRLRHDDLAVLLLAREQIRVRDESRPILVDQDQPPKLHGLARFAAFVELRVRLKQAEQLLGVGHCFSLQHAPPRRIADLLRPL